MKNFLFTLDVLKNDPNLLLKSVCVFNLRSFLNGYKMVDSSVTELIEMIEYDKRIYHDLDPIGKYILTNGNNKKSFDDLILSMEHNLKNSDITSTPGPMHDKHWVEHHRELLIQKPEMVLGDPTLVNLFHQLNGHIEAMKYMNQARAEKSTLEMLRFNNYLRNSRRVNFLCWHDFIRVFYGDCSWGISEFIKNWDEFKKQS